MLAEKVVNISTNKLYNDTMTFLESRTPNTREAYEKDIRDYFRIMCNKELESITLDDLKIRLTDVERFRLILKDMGYANSTINRRVTGLRKFLKYLKANEYDVKHEFFSEVKNLKHKPKSAGLLTPDEVFELADTILKTEREKKLIKYYLVLTAMMTSIRLEALLGVKWTDIEKHDDLYIVNAIDKGEEHVQRSISEDFYNQLVQLKEESPEYVFDIDVETVQRTMRRVTERMGIPKERNITFHSFRGVGSHFVLEATGDPKAAMRQSGHKSFDVWWNSYINKGKVDFTQMAGILMTQEVDFSVLDKLNKEQLIEVVQKLNRRSQLEFIKLSKELLSQ